MTSFIIAIDGFSSTGKSSFAQMIAKRMNFVYVDSGAIYRLVTLNALQQDLFKDGSIDQNLLKDSLESIDVSYEIKNSKSEICLNGVNVEKRIRMIDVADHVSLIASFGFVRDWVNDKLRKSVLGMNVVMDGRDIGTTVFPNAQLKIFMTADPQIRAQRRVAQLAASGSNPSFDEVYKNILERDYFDSHREVSPLKQAADAIVLDNSHMTMEQQMDWIMSIMREKFNFTFDEA